MFSDYQQSEHIKEFQQFLYGISFYNPNIPVVIPDGIFGDETAAAAAVFQKGYGLPVTGAADRETWNKAAQISEELYGEILKPEVFKRNTLMIPGSAGPGIFILQVMLNRIGRDYYNLPPLQLTGIYDLPTEISVDAFKTISGHNTQKEGVDSRVWNSIVSDFNKNII